ncbi:MAG: hypothetical protein ACKPKO_05065 [Candidatus Fonsibacter sp.]
MFVARFSINKNGNVHTYGNFDVAGNLTAPNIYNKNQVDNLLSGKTEYNNIINRCNRKQTDR